MVAESIPIMMGIRDLPIRRKLLLLGLATSGCALLVMSLAWLIVSYFIVRYNVRMILGSQVEIVSENIANAIALGNTNAATETLQALRHSPTVDMACAYDTSGALFTQYSRDGFEGACPLPAPPVDISEVRPGHIVVTHSIDLNATRVGGLYIRGNYMRLAETLRLQAWSALGGLLVGMIAALIIARRLRRTIAEPIQSLAETSSRIAQMSDYSLRATRMGNDELGELANAFNAMVAGIERRDDELRAASRLKDEFLATLSHELRTPLNAVSGWLQILQRYPVDQAKLERALASMERNTKAQVRLIEDMLDVSRIVTGKLQLKAEVVDLVAVVESAIDVSGPAATARGVRLRRELLPGPQYVTGDADRLQQVMWNLLSNAVKFTPSGGEVRVTMANDAGSFVLRVHDTGAGLAPDFLPHIFDRFRQADGSASRLHGGLGLGLAIVHDLVTMHGGRVDAASDGLGRGATFTVVLPKFTGVVDATPVPARDARRHADLDGLLVLAVDDNSESLDVAGEALSRAGARVELAADAERALSALAARPFDVLVCDLAMPNVDGFDLLRQIREERAEPGRSMPAVAVSAHAGDDAQAKARRVGFQAFVTKPYTFDALVHAVAMAAGRRV